MSMTTDSRIMEMRFDNSNFEKNVKTSLNSLDSLNKSIEGTENNTSAFEKLGSATETISAKFSALQAVAFGFFSQLGAKLETAASQMTNFISSMSTDQVSAGWEKYADKTTAVQTIMAATKNTWEETAEKIGYAGTQMEFVEDQLSKLNWFTDETSYNFTDMTDNIGKFTSQNIALDESVVAMEGISTWAALSGQNASSASRAMYNLAQALSAGYVKLQDWKSIENANMATAEFKQECIDAAVAMGTLGDASEVTVETFSSTLSDKAWLTTDVLMSVLEKYGGAANRLSQIYTDYLEDAGTTTSEFITAIDEYSKGSKTIEDIASDLNMSVEDCLPLLEEMSSETYELGLRSFKAAQEAKTFEEAIDATKDAVSTSWLNIFETIFGNYEEAKVLWTDLANDMWDIFAGPISDLSTLMADWKELGGRDLLFGKDDEENLGAFYNIMKAIKNMIDLVKEAFHDIFPEKTAQDIYNLTQKFQEFTKKLILTDEQTEKIKTVLLGVFSAISVIVRVLKEIGGVIKKVLTALSPVKGTFEDIILSISEFLIGLNESIDSSEKFANFFEGLGDKLVGVIDFFKNLGENIRLFFEDKTTKNAETFSDRFEKASDALSKFKDILLKLWEFLKPVKDFIVESFLAIENVIRDFLASLNFNTISNLLSTIPVAAFFASGASFTASLKEKVEAIGESLNGLLDGLTDTLSSLSTKFKSEALVSMAESIAILAASLIALSMVDPDRLMSAVSALAALGAVMGTLISVLAGSDSQTFKSAITGLADAFSFNTKMKGVEKLAIAIGIMAVALALLAQLSWDQIARGSAAMAIIIAELVAAMKLLSNNKKNMTTGSAAMIPFSIGMVVMAAAFKIFGSMSWESLAKAAVAMTVVIAEIVVTAKLLQNNQKSLITFAACLGYIGLGMVVFGGVFAIFSAISWEGIAKAIVSMSAIVLEIVLAAILLEDNIGSLIAFAACFSAISVGMVIMAGAFKIIETMSWEGIAKAVVTMSYIVAEIVIAAMLLSNNKASLVTFAASTVIFSAGLIVLAGALKLLATMSWQDLAKGASAISAFVIILGVAGAVLKPVIPAMYGVAGAMLLLSAAALVAGVALVAIGAGLTAIGMGLPIFVSGFVNAVETIVGMIPAFVKGVGAFFAGIIEAVIKVVGEYIPEIIGAVVTLIKAFCQAIIEAIPTIFDTIVQVLDALIEYVPQIVSKIVDFIVVVLEALAEKIPELLGAVADFFKAFFAGVAETMQGVDLTPLVQGLLMLTTAVLEMALIGQMGLAALEGLVILAAVIAGLGAIIVGLGALVDAVPNIEKFVLEGIPLLTQIGLGIGEFIGNLIGGIAEGVMSSLPAIGQSLSDFMTNLQPFITGLNGVDDNTVKAAGYLAGCIAAITAAEVVNGIGSFIIGDDGMQNFIDSMVPLANAIVAFSDAVKGKVDAESVAAAANAGKTITEFASSIPNSGGLLGAIVGNNDLDEFTEMMVPYAKAIVQFSSIVKGKVDEESVTASTNAGKSISELANTLPNSGGALGWIVGNNDLDDFADKIVVFAKAIVKYSKVVKGKVDPDAVEASTIAGESIAELAKTLPNSGGALGFIVGNNDLDDFAEKIVVFGKAIKEYSNTITKGKGIDEEAVESSAVAGKALSSLAKSLPNSGGVVSWFTGDNNIDDFGKKLVSFAGSMKSYSDALTKDGGVNTNAVIMSALAGESLSRLVKTLPNSDGLMQTLIGSKDLGTITDGLVEFGNALVEYSGAVSGDNTIDSDAIIKSADAGEALSKLANSLPSEGGLFSAFTGTTDMQGFADDIAKFGEGIANYSNAITGDNALDIDAIKSSADVGSALATMAGNIPKNGGLDTLFTGTTDMEKFGQDLETFGSSMAKYSNAITANGGIDSAAVTASATAAETLSEIYNNLPRNAFSIFGTEENDDMEIFGQHIITFASKMGTYSNIIKYMDSDAIANSNVAASALVELNNSLPEAGGIKSWFFGEKDLSLFGTNLVSFGGSLVSYGETISNVDFSQINYSGIATETLVTIASNLDKISNIAIIQSFGTYLCEYAASMANFSSTVGTINSATLDAAMTYAYKFVGLLSYISLADFEKAGSFKDTLDNLGKVSVRNFINNFDNKQKNAAEAGARLAQKAITAVEGKNKAMEEGAKNLVGKFSNAFINNQQTAYNNASNMASFGTTGLRTQYTPSYNAGVNNIDGYIAGMNSKSTDVYNTGYNIGTTAVNGAKSATKTHSPSKVFMELGEYNAEGYAIGMNKEVDTVEKASSNMGESAIESLQNTVSKIAACIDSNMDMTPTIRPVLDLSNIQNGAQSINGMFTSQTMSANVSSSFVGSQQSQNTAALDRIASSMNNRTDGSQTNSFTINVYGAEGQDVNDLADAVANRINTEMIRRKAVFA